MQNSTSPRIKKVNLPPKPFKRHKYRDALPYLMRDFDGRCAYSMQHHARAGKLEVDHFDPRLKKELFHKYDNLFPASRHCNCAKSDNWPNHEELAAGCRFLNPCKEMDYGEQILEDARTHIVIGTNPAAKWHIRMCGLNAPHLVNERRRRAEHRELLHRTIVLFKGDVVAVRQLIEHFQDEVELMIPEIPKLGVASPPKKAA
jgi:hypothetical protein